MRCICGSYAKIMYKEGIDLALAKLVVGMGGPKDTLGKYCKLAVIYCKA